jgi:hypothetical protein
MRVKDLDYHEVKKMFSHVGLNRMLNVTLVLLKQYFNVEIPGELRNPKSESNLTKRLVKICHARICGPETETTRLKFARHFFLFNLKPALLYKLTVIWSILQRKRIRKYMGGN